MNRLPGATRTTLAARYALVAPDGHFTVPRSGTDGVTETGLLGPGLGAGFAWTLIEVQPGAHLVDRDAQVTWFVLDGAARLVTGAAAPTGQPADERGVELAAGGGVTLGPGQAAAFHALSPTRLLRSTRPAVDVRARRRAGVSADVAAAQAAVHPFRLDDQPPAGFRGVAGVTVRALPAASGGDLWFVLELQPGADLPFVETHPEPHGVWLLTGRGLARLGGDWFPVAAGDALWIGAFCPHWFCALGPTPLRYLLLKQPAAA